MEQQELTGVLFLFQSDGIIQLHETHTRNYHGGDYRYINCGKGEDGSVWDYRRAGTSTAVGTEAELSSSSKLSLGRNLSCFQVQGTWIFNSTSHREGMCTVEKTAGVEVELLVGQMENMEWFGWEGI